MAASAPAAEVRPAAAPRPPAWLTWLAGLILAASGSQLAYAIHPRKGPFIGYLELACLPALALWALWRLKTGLRTLRLPPWPIWAFIVVAALSLSKATSLRAGLIELGQYTLYFLFLYMLFADAFAGRSTAGWAALATALGISALVASLQLASGAGAWDVRGLAGNRNVYSAFCAALIPLAWAGLYQPPEQICCRLRFLLVIVVAAALATMLGPPHLWIAIVAFGAVAHILSPRDFWRTAAPVMAFVIALNFLSPLHRSCNFAECLNPWETGNVYKLLREAGADENLRLVKKRWLEWYPAAAMLADNPLLGVGAGNYQLNIGRGEYWGYLPNAKKTEPDTNNLYLVTGGSMGLAGLAALVAIFGWFIRRAAAGQPRWLAVGLVAALLSLAAANMFTALLVRGAAVAWAGMLALAELSAIDRPRQTGGSETGGI